MNMEKPPSNQKNNIIQLDEEKLRKVFLAKLEKTGEKDEILDQAGDEIDLYNKRKEAGLETRGRWSIWIIDRRGQEDSEVKYIVGFDEQTGKFILMPNNAESMDREFVFETDFQAEQVKRELMKQFPDIDEESFGVMCGDIDEEQETHLPFTVIEGKKKSDKDK